MKIHFLGALVAASTLSLGIQAQGGLPEATANHAGNVVHVDQQMLVDLILGGFPDVAFAEAFELGDAHFGTPFNAIDGVGMAVGNGNRFTRSPRPDLANWSSTIPGRATGPNARSCASCHDLPAEDGAGGAGSNNHRDPLGNGIASQMINRQAPHLFGSGAVQMLGEEMTAALHDIRDDASEDAIDDGVAVTEDLEAKGVSFGTITANPDGTFDTSGVVGVDADLVVKPFDWSGVFASIRAFNRDAAHQELGMQAVEITGDNVDGDFDGVMNEFTVGDMTALAVYNAAQARPVTARELGVFGLGPVLTGREIGAIKRGREAFSAVGCAECHLPRMLLENRIFSEPSQNANFRDATFPAGQDPVARGVTPDIPVTFDLTTDHPDNIVHDALGNEIARLGSFKTTPAGMVRVALFGDLKRHDMGPGLAEGIDAGGGGNSMFLTENLWGVGATAPYLHDGRATTLTEAIWWHGGEGQAARDAFLGSAPNVQADIIAFLNNLTLFKGEEEE